MKTLIFVLCLVAGFVQAAPPSGAVIVTQQAMTNYWSTNGDTVSFSLTGIMSGWTPPGASTNATSMILALNEGDYWASPLFYAPGGRWKLSGRLTLSPTNIFGEVNFTCPDPNVGVIGDAVVFTNANFGTNTFYLYIYGDGIAIPIQTSGVITTPNYPAYDGYNAALNATNGYPWLTGRSNTWSLISATNGLNSGDFRGPLNSNGLAWVVVGVSNGVVRFKQLAP